MADPQRPTGPSNAPRAAAGKPAPKPAPKPVAKPKPPAGDDPLLANLIDSATAKFGPPCEECSNAMERGAVVCARCGFNRNTGKAIKTRVVADKGGGGRGSSVSGASALAAVDRLARSPLGYLIALGGAAVGGAVGGFIYAQITLQSGYEIFIAAVIVGLLAGFGAFLPFRQDSGLVTGAFAVIFTLVGTLGGRYFVVDTIVGKEIDQALSASLLTDEHATAMLAREVSKEFSRAGKHYQYPEDSTEADAVEQSGFPAPIWQEAETRFAALPEPQREPYRATARAEFERVKASLREEVSKEAYASSLTESGERNWRGKRTIPLKSMILWLGAACILAFGIGSAGSFSND